jgi:hypothetical protein
MLTSHYQLQRFTWEAIQRAYCPSLAPSFAVAT